MRFVVITKYTSFTKSHCGGTVNDKVNSILQVELPVYGYLQVCNRPAHWTSVHSSAFLSHNFWPLPPDESATLINVLGND